MRPSRPVLAIAGALLLGVLGVAVVGGHLAPGGGDFVGTTYDPPEPAPAFTLTDHTGDEVSLGDYRGTALLVFFGFTSCPDVCPLTLRKLSRVLGSMEVDTDDVRILLVTVDPVRDTPAALARYVARFGSHPVGLTGDAAALAELRRRFGVYAGPHPGEHAVDITHTPAVFGIDRAGDLRVLLPMEEDDAVVAADIRRLM